MKSNIVAFKGKKSSVSTMPKPTVKVLHTEIKISNDELTQAIALEITNMNKPLYLDDYKNDPIYEDGIYELYYSPEKNNLEMLVYASEDEDFILENVDIDFVYANVLYHRELGKYFLHGITTSEAKEYLNKYSFLELHQIKRITETKVAEPLRYEDLGYNYG